MKDRRSMKTCCTPSRAAGSPFTPQRIARARARGEGVRADGVVVIPGGLALLGTDDPVFAVDGEGPLRQKKIGAFAMDATTVTNARFAAFVDDTEYVTDAERLGNSLVFQGLLPPDTPPSHAVADAPWWRLIPGANWRAAVGPHGPKHPQSDHPVTHVSYNDANAFATWAGGRLPSEAEWEHAARGGLGDVPFPWGTDAPDDVNFQPCNIWQGRFPQCDLGLDGYMGTAPARSFAPNGYGLYNMVGNVWELTRDTFKVRSLKTAVIAANAARKGFRLSKGGSYLCHRSYCFRYRIASRNSASHDTSTGHMGFRLVYGLA